MVVNACSIMFCKLYSLIVAKAQMDTNTASIQSSYVVTKSQNQQATQSLKARLTLF